MFEIPNCFDGRISDVEMPAHKNDVRIMISRITIDPLVWES